ncbi:MAG: hypothetical protein ACM33T_02450 [Solirubrobacterales bacterium]
MTDRPDDNSPDRVAWIAMAVVAILGAATLVWATTLPAGVAG